jgi:membrane protein
MESQGKWVLDLPVSELFSSEWAKALELRGQYLKLARNIRLKDL